MKRTLSSDQLRKLEEDPITAMTEQAIDAREVPIAEHGDAANPPGTDPNGEPADPVASEDRLRPVRYERDKAPVARSGVMDESFEDVVRR